MLQLITQVHDIAEINHLKIASEKFLSILPTVKYLVNEIGFLTIKPIKPKNAATQKFPSPTTTMEQMRYSGSMNFFSEFFD